MQNRYKDELTSDLYRLCIRGATALVLSACVVFGATVGGLMGKEVELRVLSARVTRNLPVAPMLAGVNQ
jgi:hypothetical protein